jgi:hypothetical protein
LTGAAGPTIEHHDRIDLLAQRRSTLSRNDLLALRVRADSCR